MYSFWMKILLRETLQNVLSSIVFKNRKLETECQWLTPEILPTQKAEIRRMGV
jgi:hypothetical protein